MFVRCHVKPVIHAFIFKKSQATYEEQNGATAARRTEQQYYSRRQISTSNVLTSVSNNRRVKGEMEFNVLEQWRMATTAMPNSKYNKVCYQR